jgi:hypothetical protein
MTEYLWHFHGDADLPIAATDVSDGQLFSAWDPGADQLLSLFETAVNAELAASWTVARVGTALASASPIARTIYEQPRKALLREASLQFPLLALYRTESEFEERTLTQEVERCTWRLDYILGPLTVEDYRRLGAALTAVKKVVALCIRLRGHPEFESGALQFGDGKGRFGAIRIVSAEQGPAEFGPDGEGPEYHCLAMKLETTELEAPQADLDTDFEGVDFSLAVGGKDDALPDAVLANTDAEQEHE